MVAAHLTVAIQGRPGPAAVGNALCKFVTVIIAYLLLHLILFNDKYIMFVNLNSS